MTQLGLDYETEVLTAQGYRLDLVLQAGGVTIGVEVEGPHSFVHFGGSGTAGGLSRTRVPGACVASPAGFAPV